MQQAQTDIKKTTSVSLWNVTIPSDEFDKLDQRYKEWADSFPLGVARPSKTAFYRHIIISAANNKK